MTGTKTNERPGTRAQHRHARLSATKARAVLDLIRDQPVDAADEILAFTERDAARVIRKVLDSAIANAGHNDDVPADELYVSACYADEGPTLKRWRPRARGRATRIRKRTCHITIIVSRMPTDLLERRRRAEDAARAARSGTGAARAARDATGERRRRVAKSRAAAAVAEQAEAPTEEPTVDDVVEEAVVDDAVVVEDAVEETAAEETAAEDTPAEDEVVAEATEENDTAGEDAAADADVEEKD